MEVGQKVIPIHKSIGCHLKESPIFDDLPFCSTCTIVKIYSQGIVELESFHGYRDFFSINDIERSITFE